MPYLREQRNGVSAIACDFEKLHFVCQDPRVSRKAWNAQEGVESVNRRHNAVEKRLVAKTW